MSESKEILKKYWNHDDFRGLQESVINAVLEKKDVVALMPTGSGKSICFQIPALLNDGTCLVISPLIALMKDQVSTLQKKGISAISINSSLNYKEVINVLNNASEEKYKFIYLSPERLDSNIFKEYLQYLNINLIAVDEAHCISQWGYDFRPSYLKISTLKESFPQTPIIALTASATPQVQDDIVKYLELKNAAIFHQSFKKENHSYSVFNVDSKINKAIEILEKVKGSSIIYCKNRKLTQTVSDLLKLQKINSDFYHAGLSQEIRNQKQEDWISNKTRVIVCTNAFGMGIDKPDVRTVIHYDIPECIENYYQEAGRAGRDNKKAYSVLLYNQHDLLELNNLIQLRFPTVQIIRSVYQSLADFLQIPVGIGEGNSYDFDISLFSKNFKLEFHLILSVLKILEHEGHIIVTENIFIPSKIKITADKYVLNEFENLHPKLEVVLKSLLRTYTGILDNLVPINEKQIASIANLPYTKIYEDLEDLKKLGIINYIPQKETPQILFLLNRAPASSLHINHENYFNRKKQFEIRLECILNYVSENSLCRSQFISNYFSKESITECGICDNCLQNKKTELTTKEFEFIKGATIEKIKMNPIKVNELLNHLTKFSKEKNWKVLDFLQDENIIEINQQGIIKLLKS